MKALTVRQPWAWAIAIGVKTTENRTWPARERGPLVIHAGGRWSADGADDPAVLAAMGARMTRWELDHQQIDPAAHRGVLHLSALIAVVDVVGCHVAAEECCQPWGQHFDAESGNQMWHWELAHARQLAEPVPSKGRLGLWDVAVADPTPAVP